MHKGLAEEYLASLVRAGGTTLVQSVLGIRAPRPAEHISAV